MKKTKYTLLLIVPFLISCSNKTEQKEMESQLNELNAKIEKIQKANDSLTSSKSLNTESPKQKEEESGNSSTSGQESLSQTLIKDLQNQDYILIAKKWSKLYDQLPQKYKNTIYTSSNDSYKMDYGDLYGLNKGFYWGLCGNYENNELGNTITDEFGATGGKSKTVETQGYRAGMVYFYVKYQLLKCSD